MQGAIQLGSMRRSILRNVPGLWDQWRAMMRGVLDQANRDVLGAEATEWREEPGPEHERAGRS